VVINYHVYGRNINDSHIYNTLKGNRAILWYTLITSITLEFYLLKN